MINSFRGEYRWLSNFWYVPVRLDGEIYPSVEHAYQAAKTLNPKERCKFQDASMKPGQAKRLGRIVELRKDWEDVKLDIMLSLLRQKFTGKLGRQLDATTSQELIEGNDWHDYFWGVCGGKGQNHLGRLIMQIRRERREGSEKG